MLDIFKAKSDVTADDIDVGLIRTDGETQMRAKLDEETIVNYAEKMKAGDKFPPIDLYYDGQDYWIGDGFHRVAAHKLAYSDSPTVPAIDANVRSGSRRQAILHAVRANDTHGLPRTNADKRRSVLKLLADEEWTQWSDRAIADACAVTHPLVAKLRKELSGNDYHISAARTVHRNGQTYTQDTTKIAAANQERKRKASPAPVTRPEPPVVVLSPEPPRDRRSEAAATIVRNIDALLSDIDEVYGGLTGHYSHIPPAKRALMTMRAELQALIEALGKR